MAWSAPMTAVANTAFTAAQFNQYVRDNLNETAPAKASAADQFFVSTAANAIAARSASGNFVGTNETTTSTSYTDLTTSGPTVTITTGATAIVFVTAQMWCSANAIVYASYEVTGASAISASDARSTSVRIVTGGDANAGGRCDAVVRPSTLTPGSNTFTMKYRTSAGTARYDNRQITVLPV